MEKDNAMTNSMNLNLLAGAFQLLVAAYALRLNRSFGPARVGWSLFATFSLLALLHLVQATTPFTSGAFAQIQMEAAYLIISFLVLAFVLITCIVQMETMCKNSLFQVRSESQDWTGIKAGIQPLGQPRSGLLAPSCETYPLAKRGRCRDSQPPPLFDCFSEMIAHLPAKSIARVLAEESYMLEVDLMQQRPLSPTEANSILIFSHFVGAGGKSSGRLVQANRLPGAHVAFYQTTLERLIAIGDLPAAAQAEFENIFGVLKPKVTPSLRPQIRNRAPQFQLAEFAHC